MTHLKRFGLKNFRVFKEMTEFDFAPITLLTGTNSSGKSSLIKALLLLKENSLLNKNMDIEALEHLFEGESIWESDSIRLKIIPSLEKLEFTGSSHKLSGFKACLNNNSKDNSINFSLPFTLINPNDCSLLLTYSPGNNENTVHGNLDELSIFHLSEKKLLFQISQITTKKGRYYIDYDFFINTLNTSDNEFLKDASNKDVWLSEKFSKLDFSEPLFPFPYLDEKTFSSIIPDLNSEEHYEALKIILNENNLVFPSDNIKEYIQTFLKEHITEISESVINEIQDVDFSIGRINNLSSLKKALVKFGGVLMNVADANRNQDLDLSKYSFNTLFSHLARNVVYFDFTQRFWLEGGLVEHLNRSYNENNIFQYLDKEKHAALIDFLFLTSTLFKVLRTKPVYLPALQLLFYNSEKRRVGNKERIVYIIFRIIKEGLSNSLSKLNSINFIEAIRANTQRAYAYQSQGTGFNDLLSQFNSKYIEKDDDKYSFIEKWIKIFGIGNKLSLRQNPDGLGHQIYIDNKSLADIGYGITQFLPILIKIAVVAKENSYYCIELDENTNETIFDGYKYRQSMIMIEEPETNLHPKLQSLLADMFVDASKQFKIQFIIETHSEYLIRKLQYLTAKKDHMYNIKPEYTAVYYFIDPKSLKKGEKQVKTIRIRENGVLDGSFGSGFFDEASNMIVDILKISSSN